MTVKESVSTVVPHVAQATREPFLGLGVVLLSDDKRTDVVHLLEEPVHCDEGDGRGDYDHDDGEEFVPFRLVLLGGYDTEVNSRELFG